MAGWDTLSYKYMWKTRGENCPLCDAMAGRVYTYDTWISASVVPGFHLHCNCYLQRMADDYPVSDLDIFGSDFDIMLDNHYLLFFNYDHDWIPYNRYFTNQISGIMRQSGMSISEAFKSLTNLEKQGSFYKSPIAAWDQFFQWRVFRTLQLNQSPDGTLSATLEPEVTVPKAVDPGQSYKNQRNWE